MLKRVTAISLLILAVSPFTAPFSAWDVGNGNETQIAPLESLLSARQSARSLSVAPSDDAGSFAHHSGRTLVTSIETLDPAGFSTRVAASTGYTGDYHVSTAILRL